MLSKSFITLCKCRWREFRREPSAFFWVIFMPLLWMLILGLTFSKPRQERYGIAVLGVSDSFTVLEQNAHLKVYPANQEDFDALMKRGEVVLGLKSEQGKLLYLLDPTNPTSTQAKRYVDEVIQTSLGRRDAVATEISFVESEGGRYIDFLVPGLLGLSIMTSSLFGVGMTIVSNRKENLLKRYLATPMRKSEFLLSHVVGRLIVLAYEFASVTLAAYLIFSFHIQGGIIPYFLFSVLGAACFTAIALLCASRTASIPAMGGMVNLITLPLMLLSGVFFSRTNFPDWMQPWLKLLPLTALNDGLRKISLEAAGFKEIAFEAVILAFYFAVAAVLARVRFKWDKV